MDGRHFAVIGLNAGNFDFGEGGDAHFLCLVDVAHHNTVGVNQAVLVVERPGKDIIELHERQAAADFITVEPLGVHTQFVLQLEIAFEGGYIVLLGQKDEIAALAVVDFLADFFGEAFEHGQALEGKFDVAFCLNLLRDLSPKRKDTVMQRMLGALKPAGFLVLDTLLIPGDSYPEMYRERREAHNRFLDRMPDKYGLARLNGAQIYQRQQARF